MAPHHVTAGELQSWTGVVEFSQQGADSAIALCSRVASVGSVPGTQESRLALGSAEEKAVSTANWILAPSAPGSDAERYIRQPAGHHNVQSHRASRHVGRCGSRPRRDQVTSPWTRRNQHRPGPDVELPSRSSDRWPGHPVRPHGESGADSPADNWQALLHLRQRPSRSSR